MAVKLVLPDKKYLKSFIEACNEISKYSPWEERIYSYSDDMFEKFEQRRKGINLKPGYVADTHLWLVEGDEFIGAVGIRHQLNEKLLGFGPVLVIFPALRPGWVRCGSLFHAGGVLQLFRDLFSGCWASERLAFEVQPALGVFP